MQRGGRVVRQLAFGLGAALWVLGLSACSTARVNQVAASMQTHAATRPLHQTLSDVPFVAQEDHECGPAVLQMLLRSAGTDAPIETLVQQAYTPEKRGTLQLEMLSTVRRHGRLAYPIAPTLDALFDEVAAGHPVGVFVNLSLAIAPVWHYAVVLGYDVPARTITLHSGVTENMTMSLYAFDRIWARAGSWAFLALPPTELPASAVPDDLLKALHALELSDAQAAEIGYASAMQRWPDDPRWPLAWSNAAYTRHDLLVASQRLENATAAFPAYADAWNNLAQVRSEMHDTTGARYAIARAIAMGGPHAAQYRALQDSLQTPLKPAPPSGAASTAHTVVPEN
jgi:hypothetical protein